MTNTDAQLKANVAHFRSLTAASVAKLNAQSDENLLWLRDAASTYSAFLNPVVGPRKTANPAPPPSSRRARRPPRPHVAAKTPTPSIRKTRRTAKAEQRELIANAAIADKENIENAQTAIAPPLPTKRRTRARKGQQRAPLALVPAEPLPTSNVSDVKPEVIAAAERQDPGAVAEDSNAGTEAGREKDQEEDVMGSSEKRTSTPFNSALSHRSGPEGGKISGHHAAPGFEDKGERQGTDEAMRARDWNSPTGNEGAQMVVDVTAAEGPAGQSRRRGKTSISDAPDDECDDAGDEKDPSSNERDAVSTPSHDTSTEPVQRLTRARMRRGEVTTPEKCGDGDSSDDDSPILRRRRCLRKRTEPQRCVTDLKESDVIKSPLPRQVETKSSVPARDVSPLEASAEIAEECPQMPLIDSGKLEDENQSLEVECKAKEAKIDSRSQSRLRLQDKTRSGSRLENDRSDNVSPLPMNTEKSDEGSKAGDDSIAPCASEAIKYKMPQPRQRRALTGLSAHIDHGLVAPSLSSAVKAVPQTPQGQQQLREHTLGFGAQSGTGHRFAVDENGKLGQQGIGALSEIVSTPSAAARPKPLLETGAGDQSSVRSTRLFRPTNNIYSAKKSGTLSVQKALGSKSSMQVLHTPGARTPGKVVSASPQVHMQPTINNALPNCSNASRSNANVAFDRNASLLSNARSGQGVLCENRGTKGDNRELAFWDPAAEHSKKTAIPARPLNKELKFSFAEQSQGPGFRSRATASPEREVHNKVTRDRDSKPFSHLPPQPKTAPGKPGPRPRIEGKLVKSALRCRIEKMLAAKSLPTPQIKEKENSPHPNNVESCSSPARQNAPQDSPFDDGNEHASYVRETPSQQTNDGSEVVVTAQLVSAPLDGGAKEKQGHSQGKRVSGASHSTHSGADLVAKASVSLSSEGITPTQQSGGGHSGDSDETSHTHIKPQERVGDSVTPDPATTTESARKPELSPGEGIGHESAIEQGVGSKNLESIADETVPRANTHSNLVSSVSSFLPTALNIFGTRAEEKPVSSDAKLAAKRQRQDIERREAEVVARREAQRAAKQKEIEEKQRKAESRRRLIAEAAKHRDDERRRKEQLRARKRQEEEERQRIRKEEDDKRKEEHRRHVLEQKRQMDKAAQQKEVDTKRPQKVSKLPRAKLGQHGTDGTTSKLKQYRPAQTHSRLPPTGSSRVAKVLTSDSMPPPPPKTPKSHREKSQEEEPQWVISGERKRGPSESSIDERERRRQKTIPSWAGGQTLLSALQSEKSDPDALFARGAPSCNLETVFEVDEERKRKYRTRDASGDWTKDRLTAKEEMEYKRQAGFFDNA